MSAIPGSRVNSDMMTSEICNIPIAESKSGTIAANVTINNWKCLRESDHC